MKIFSLSLSASQIIRDELVTSHSANFIKAKSKKEAKKRGLQMAKAQYPLAEEWLFHSVEIFRLP